MRGEIRSRFDPDFELAAHHEPAIPDELRVSHAVFPSELFFEFLQVWPDVQDPFELAEWLLAPFGLSTQPRGVLERVLQAGLGLVQFEPGHERAHPFGRDYQHFRGEEKYEDGLLPPS